jgi:uncharacterized protein (DUF1501 family)
VVLPGLRQYRLFRGSFSACGDGPQDRLFRAWNALQLEEGESGRLEAGPRGPGSTLAFLQQVALDALVSSERLGAADGFQTTGRYGVSSLGRDLELVARIIGCGAGTRVFHVCHRGYDTHSEQLAKHARLLSELDQALAGFAADMRAQGNWGRVTLMTFSEFGRRVAVNSNGGTDHGAASSLLVLGGGIRSGLYGEAPSLAPQDLLLGDPRQSTDFRSVYATIIEKRLGAASLPVLGRAFPLLGFA